MPSPTVLPVEPLLAPISDDEPAGVKLPLPDRNKLKEYREDFDPARDVVTEEDRNDPRIAGKQKVVPQWDKVVQFGTQFLQRTGKDLTVALAMVEALTRRAGFAGLRDGLALLTGLCGACWDRLHPVIDDPSDPDDVEGRTLPFTSIDDELNTPYFPGTVRGLTLFVTADGDPVSYLACRSFEGSKLAKVSPEQFGAAVAAAGPEQVERVGTLAEDIDACLAELAVLVATLDAKAGATAPGLGGLRRAILDCQTIVVEFFRLKGGGAPTESSPAAATTASDVPAPTGGAPAPAVRSRDDVYAKLNELTAMLEKFDPHSPVPFLIRRAMEMRDMKFPELVDRLNADKRMLEFIRTPLGEQQG